MSDLIIIGGGGAGLTAALKAKSHNGDANVTIISDDTLSYSPCSLPFVISGEIDSFDKISHSLEEICKQSDISCVIDEAVSIDTKKKLVKTKNGKEFSYTSLVLATGAIPCIPPIPGADLDGVYPLQKIEDAKRILEKAKKSKSAVVIGGGAIGAEAAASLRNRRLEVTLVELLPNILATPFDPDFSAMVEDKLREKGITLVLGKKAEKILGRNSVEAVLAGGKKIPADLVVFGVGMKPNTGLAEKAGIETCNGIKTDEWMQTSIEGIYAAGDCVFTQCLVTGEPTLSQLGTSAIRQGTAAGTNAVGGYATIEGVLNSVSLRIFDLEIGRTGLTEGHARERDIETVTGHATAKTKADYFPGAKDIHVKLIFDASNHKIIGGQIAGYAGVAEKIDLLAFAICMNADINDLAKLKYGYTPPLTPEHNVIALAAENASRKLDRIKEVRKRKF